ncbi:MAG: lysylphosphatidylglycerol synthase transmembrane domain-containing protein [Myxococcaceae bacterium]
MSRKLKKVLPVVGFLIGMALFASVFFKLSFTGLEPQLTPRFDLGAFARQLPKQLPWVLPFIVLTALALPARALQWQSTLARKVPFKERYHLVAIGALVQNVIPGQMGDPFRALAMARTQKLSFVQTFGSVLVCKLLEFVSMLGLVGLSFLGPFSDRLGSFSAALEIALGACVALLILVVLLARYAERLAASLGRHGKWRRTVSFLIEAGAGLSTARSARGLARALLLSVPPVLTSVLGYGLGLQALGVQDGVFGGAVVLGAIVLGRLLPGVPTGPGVYYFLCAGAARLLGVPAIDAAAFAMLTHLSTVGTQLGMGAISMAVRKLRLSELRRSARAAAQGQALEQSDRTA